LLPQLLAPETTAYSSTALSARTVRSAGLRDSSKSRRHKADEVWVLHAPAEWSQSHIEQPHEFVSEALHEAFE